MAATLIATWPLPITLGSGRVIAPGPSGGIRDWFAPDGRTSSLHRIYRYEQGGWRMPVSERVTAAS